MSEKVRERAMEGRKMMQQNVIWLLLVGRSAGTSGLAIGAYTIALVINNTHPSGHLA